MAASVLFKQPIGGLPLRNENTAGSSTLNVLWTWLPKKIPRCVPGRFVPLILPAMQSFVAEHPVYTVIDTEQLIIVTGICSSLWQEAVGNFVRQKLRGRW